MIKFTSKDLFRSFREDLNTYTLEFLNIPLGEGKITYSLCVKVRGFQIPLLSKHIYDNYDITLIKDRLFIRTIIIPTLNNEFTVIHCTDKDFDMYLESLRDLKVYKSGELNG